MVQDNNSKKDTKSKKNAKSRDALANTEEESDISRMLTTLIERVNSLGGEMTLLRAETAAAKTTKTKRATKYDLPTEASADAILDHLREMAETTARQTGDIAGAVLFAQVISPGDTGEAQTVSLRFIGDAMRRGDLRVEREGALHDRAARIAASLGAQPRIVLARLLLTEDTMTATELGIGADLTTGSLYHHLREMTHSGVLAAAARNRYVLTPLGRRVLLLLLALAQEEETT